MKPFISRLSQHHTLFFFPLLLLLRWKWKFYVFLVLSVIILAGCFRKFYSAGSVSQVDSATIEKLKTSNKFFIIHYKDSILQLNQVTVNQGMLSGKNGPLPPEHAAELDARTDKSNVFKNRNRSAVLSEVHLYVNMKKSATKDYPEVNVPLSDIYRLDVYEFDQARTTMSTVLSVVGIAATGALIVLIIVAASATEPASTGTETADCDCPQVYVEQKGNFDYQNGIFSGAVYANLERTDYLPLVNIQPENADIRLRISSHENEIQYLNSTRLIGVFHRPGSLILADRYGKFYSIRNPELPQGVLGPDKQDLKERLSEMDGNSFAFDTNDSGKEFSNAFLTFRKSPENRKAKLLIRAKNSHWAAVVNQEYTLLFGEDYIPYREKWENTSPEKMEAFILNQGLPIRVYIENGGKWEYAGYFPLAGTEGYRDMVMEINLPVNTDQRVRIKLETVYRFWDLDYAAIDFTEEDSLQTFTLDPVSAKNAGMVDQKEQLTKKDNKYTELKNDESVDIAFHVPDNGNMNPVSYFLASGGYYHIQSTYPVKADVTRLKKFKKPGEFDRFSREKYMEMKQWQSLTSQMKRNAN